MSARNAIVGIAGSLIATGIGWYVKGPNTGLIILGIGFILLIIAYFVGKKPEEHLPPVSVHQDNRQEFNPQLTVSPQQIVYVGGRDDEAERERKERDHHDKIVLEYIKQQREHRPNMTYLVADVASAVSLTFHEADQTLQRLFAKGFLYRSGIDAPGDFVYWYRGPDE